MGMNNGYPFATKAQIAERIRTDDAFRDECVKILVSIGIRPGTNPPDRYAHRLARYFRERDMANNPNIIEKAKQYGVVPGVKPAQNSKPAVHAATKPTKKPEDLPSQIIGLLEDKPLTMTSIAKLMPEADPGDIAASVTKLVQLGQLNKAGRGPGTRYGHATKGAR